VIKKQQTTDDDDSSTDETPLAALTAKTAKAKKIKESDADKLTRMRNKHNPAHLAEKVIASTHIQQDTVGNVTASTSLAAHTQQSASPAFVRNQSIAAFAAVSKATPGSSASFTLVANAGSSLSISKAPKSAQAPLTPSVQDDLDANNFDLTNATPSGGGAAGIRRSLFNSPGLLVSDEPRDFKELCMFIKSQFDELKASLNNESTDKRPVVKLLYFNNIDLVILSFTFFLSFYRFTQALAKIW
jgi:hypothetical protein